MGVHYDDSHVIITFPIEHNTSYCNAGICFLFLDVAPMNMMYLEELLRVAVVK